MKKAVADNHGSQQYLKIAAYLKLRFTTLVDLKVHKLLIKVYLNGGYDRVISQFHNPIISSCQLSLIGLRTVLHQLAYYPFLASQSPFEETSVMAVVSTIILIQTTVASNSEEGAIGARPASCLTKFSSSEEIVGFSTKKFFAFSRPWPSSVSP